MAAAVVEEHNIAECLTALADSTDDVAKTVLGFEGAQVVGSPEELSSDALSGAYIALVGDKATLQIGLASNPEGCQILAKAMLGMEPEEEVDEGDVVDCLGEIANIIAGMVKSKLVEWDESIKLGIPMVINGHIRMSDNSERAAVNINIGDVQSQLLVIRKMG